MKCWSNKKRYILQINTIMPHRKGLLYKTVTPYVLSLSQSQSHIATDGQSVSKSWYRAQSGAHDQIFISVRQLRSCFRGAPSLTRGRVCLCMCRWLLPTRSFSGPSPLGLATVFYCLRFETSLFVASYGSQGHSGGIRPRLHTGHYVLYYYIHSFSE
jgi:hypothetical protein